MEEVYPYLYSIATNLSSSLLVAGGRRVRDEALGGAQERALRKVFEEATAAVLVEVARHDRAEQGLPNRLAVQFGKFYGDRLVAEMLVGFAISAEEPPIDDLRRRYVSIGNDPGALPMDFGEAMRFLVYEPADRLRKEASRAGSPLTNLVLVRQLGIIRATRKGRPARWGREMKRPPVPLGLQAERTPDGTRITSAARMARSTTSSSPGSSCPPGLRAG